MQSPSCLIHGPLFLARPFNSCCRKVSEPKTSRDEKHTILFTRQISPLAALGRNDGNVQQQHMLREIASHLAMTAVIILPLRFFLRPLKDSGDELAQSFTCASLRGYAVAEAISRQHTQLRLADYSISRGSPKGHWGICRTTNLRGNCRRVSYHRPFRDGN